MTTVIWAQCALAFAIGTLCGGTIVNRLSYARGYDAGYAEGRGWLNRKKRAEKNGK